MHVLLIVDLLTKWRSFCPFAKICADLFCDSWQPLPTVCARHAVLKVLVPTPMFKALDERIEEKGLPFAVSIWSFAVDTC